MEAMASASFHARPGSLVDMEGDYGYDELVDWTTQKMPTFAPLKRFLASAPAAKPTMSLITFPSRNDGGAPHYRTDGLTVEGLKKIVDTESMEQHQLLLVQNITPDVVRLLGDKWKIPPDFFLSHLENSNWYSLWNIQQNLPTLRSVCQSYVRFQFIGPREVETERTVDEDGKGMLIALRNMGAGLIGCLDVYSSLPDRMHELDSCNNEDAATIGRTAGGFNPTYPPPRVISELNPTVKADMPFMPVAMVRSTVTTWFDVFDHDHIVNETGTNASTLATQISSETVLEGQQTGTGCSPQKETGGRKEERAKWKRGTNILRRAVHF
jgi:hypothetical protein